MIGRADERAVIERIVAAVRSGRSAAVVFVGEPGVGKSVLLAHATELVDGMRVLRVSGVESEIDLAFAGLDQLLRPVLSLVERLPARQADALLGALGQVDHVSHDRFLVGAATLSLLSEAAEEAPMLCVVDDVQWLDRPSVEALTFAARRLDAEGIAIIAASREAGLSGLPELEVTGFGLADAARLMSERTRDVAPGVVERLVEETGGNPLALEELVKLLSADQLAGRDPLPRTLPAAPRVQQRFLARVRDLPEASQTLLLVAAADDTADIAIILAAAERLDVAADAVASIERAELASVDDSGGFVFRHPLVRAAVYHASTYPMRLAVHRALATAQVGDEHAERRIWHLAAATATPDETIAAELERAAKGSRRRGGHAVASAAMERAAELTPAATDRTRRSVAAAEEAFQAGLADRAADLASRAMRSASDPIMSNEVTVLRGRIEFARGNAVSAHALLMAAARGLAERDPRAAAAVLVEAARAAWNAYDAKRYTETAGLLATVEPPEGDPLRPVVATAIAVSDYVEGRPGGPIRQIRRGIESWMPLVRADQITGDDAFIKASVALTGFARVIGDDAAGLMLGAAAVADCRRRGLIGWLPSALVSQSMTQAIAGRHSDALVSGTEGLRLARDLDQPTAICGGEAILAWLAAVRGDEERCCELATSSIRLAEKYQLAAIAVIATWALGLLDLSAGRPDRAHDHLADPLTGPLSVPSVRCLITPDLVEAAVRSGRTGTLADTIDWYAEWAQATGQATAEAMVHRCRALLDHERAEPHYLEALRLHEAAGPQTRPFDRARTQLVYGQWLRRTRRRTDARPQLTAAHDAFERLQATPWAERAATELRATGQRVPRREVAAVRLTPQELEVVRLVAEGGSNRDVAAQLFLSPRTVAYHLYKAFPKLGVASRADLARLDLDSIATE